MAPVAWAVWRRRAALLAGWLLPLSGLWSLAAVAVSRFYPIPELGLTLAGGLILTAAGGLILLLRRPGPLEVARAGDQAGLKERLTTALELGPDESMLARAQRDDAIRALQGGAWRAPLRVHWPTRMLAAALAVAGVAGLLLLLPDKAAEVTRVRTRVQSEAKKQADMVAQSAAEMASAQSASLDPTRQRAAEALRRLEEKLRQTEGGEQAMVDLTEAARELEKLADLPQVRQGRALMELGSALASTERARQAGEAMARRDWASAQQGMNALAEQLEEAARREREQNAANADGQNQSGGSQTGQNQTNNQAQGTQGTQNQPGQTGQGAQPPAGEQGQQGRPALSRQEREAMARLFAEASRNMSGNPELQRQMQQLARELMSGQNQQAAADLLRQVAQQMAQAGARSDTQQSLAETMRQLQNASQAVARAQQGPQPAGQQRPSATRGNDRQAQSGMGSPGLGQGLPPVQRQAGPQSQGTGQFDGNQGQQGQGAAQASQGESGAGQQPGGFPGQGQNPTLGQGGNPGSGQLPGEGNGQGQGQGDGAGGGRGEGQGQGQGFAQLQALGLLMGQGGGQGDGQGSGFSQPNGETRAGTVSSDQVSAGGLTQAPGQAGSGEPPRNYRQFDQIYSPTRLGGESAPDYIGGGALGEGSGQAVETESSPIGAPVLRSYSQVYAEYEQMARQGLERAELPSSYQESVKRYFSNLSPENR